MAVHVLVVKLLESCFLWGAFMSQLEVLSYKLAEKLVYLFAQLENKYKIFSLSTKYQFNQLKKQLQNSITESFKTIIENITLREESKIIYQKLIEKISSELLDCLNE